MRQHDEAEILVLVELARAHRRSRPDGLVDERLVGEQLLEQHADLLATGRAVMRLERGLRVLHESVECIGHDKPSPFPSGRPGCVARSPYGAPRMGLRK